MDTQGDEINTSVSETFGDQVVIHVPKTNEEELKDSLLMKIFELLDATTTQMTNNNPELLTFDVRTDSLVNLAGPTTSRKSLNLRKNLHKTVLFYKLLEHIAELLINDKTDNIRSFYYTLKDSAIAPVTVSEIDICIQEIASLFSCRTWDLRIVGAMKGVAVGRVAIKMRNGETIDFDTGNKVLIPPRVDIDVAEITSRVSCIIVVEKDTVFQSIVKDCPSAMNCLLVTGKGMPDVATRLFVKFLNEKLEIPVYVLVDSNPHGVQIMCIYKYGSMRGTVENNRALACTSARWVGVHPSDVEGMKVPVLPLTDNDKKILDSLKSRLVNHIAVLRQLVLMEKGKAEIESIAQLSPDFLVKTYLPEKITNNLFI